MRKLLTILCLSIFAFTSCSDDGAMGPQGPRGPEGPPGEDGIDGLGYTFEETVTFDYFPDVNLWYSPFITIPENVATINPDADAVLVYLQEIVEADDGEDLETWSLLPQNFFVEEGTIQYVYNHTVSDVEIIIDGNFDLSSLDPGFTDGLTFRIVVVPSDFLASGVNVSNYNEVMSELKIQEENIRQLDLKK